MMEEPLPVGPGPRPGNESARPDTLQIARLLRYPAPMGVEGFISRWHGREGGAERANYVLFLRELTDGLGLPIPEPADTDSSYRFEYPVRGDHGPPLRIDLYKKGAFILEAKQSRLAENAFRRGDRPGRPLRRCRSDRSRARPPRRLERRHEGRLQPGLGLRLAAAGRP